MNKKKSTKKKVANKKKEKKKVIRFEDCLDEINEEISKKRGKWNLKAIAWMDYEDVSQIIRFHIFKKWHLYDPSKRLKPWIRTIISNQIKNLVRNNYSNFVKPCARCAAAVEETGCTIYKEQSSACPLYKNWEMNKKSGMHAKIPVPLENHSQEVYVLENNISFDIVRSARNLHKKMKEVLKNNEWRVYEHLYIKYKSEIETAELMGYKTTEKNRPPGYKQIKNIKKRIIQKAKDLIANDEIDIY